MSETLPLDGSMSNGSMPEGSMPDGSMVIGIGGCSGSGKTTLARELVTQLDATLVPMDVYYHDLSEQPIEQRHLHNFDAPESLDLPLMVSQIRDLRAGYAVDQPVYDFRTHTRETGRHTLLQPERFVVAEGILALHFAELLPLYALRVYVDTPHAVCLARRTARDVRERGRTAESSFEQFHRFTRPMAERYVLPSQRHADLSVDGTTALDWSVEAVLEELRRRGLLGGRGSVMR